MNSDDKDHEEEEQQDGDPSEIIPPEILENMSDPARNMVRETIGMFAGPMANPISKKVTSEHITKMLDESAAQTEADNRFRASNRWFVLCYVILGILIFGTVTVWFSKDDPELYRDILSHLAAAIAGIAAGWGYSETRK